MYGITGTWDPESTNSEHLESVVARMANAICHQGSTDTETWIDPENGLALGFSGTRRMDPSPLGVGSLVSTTARYVVAFNGQIYNSHELRRRLAQVDRSPKESSCIEAVRAAVEEWGIEAAVRRFIGVFVMAV